MIQSTNIGKISAKSRIQKSGVRIQNTLYYNQLPIISTLANYQILLTPVFFPHPPDRNDFTSLATELSGGQVPNPTVTCYFML